MDRLPDIAKEQRAAHCDLHGAYISTHIVRSVWSSCGVCNAARLAEEARVRAHEEAHRIEREHRHMIDVAAIPARFIGSSFVNYVADTDAKRHAVTVARDYAEGFESYASKGSSLILAGRPGTGKSHLAGAILQALLQRSVRYLTCMDVIRAVRGTWRRDSEKSEAELLRHLASLELLVIDEVGMQYGTEGEQNILFDVLDRRYRDLKPVVLLTNQDKAGFKAYVGERTYDRLVETSRWVPFDWDSHRATARKAA